MKSSLAVLLLCGAALSGCATFSKDGGFDTVADAARSQLGKDVRWTRSAAERTKSSDQAAPSWRTP